MYRKYGSDLCRLCLQKGDELVYIFQRSERNCPTIAQAISDLFHVPVSIKDQYPKYICRECYSKVMGFYRMQANYPVHTLPTFVLFRNQCEIVNSTVDYAMRYNVSTPDLQHSPMSSERSPFSLELEEIAAEDELRARRDAVDKLLVTVAQILKNIQSGAGLFDGHSSALEGRKLLALPDCAYNVQREDYSPVSSDPAPSPGEDYVLVLDDGDSSPPIRRPQRCYCRGQQEQVRREEGDGDSPLRSDQLRQKGDESPSSPGVGLRVGRKPRRASLKRVKYCENSDSDLEPIRPSKSVRQRVDGKEGGGGSFDCAICHSHHQSKEALRKHVLQKHLSKDDSQRDSLDTDDIKAPRAWTGEAESPSESKPSGKNGDIVIGKPFRYFRSSTCQKTFIREGKVSKLDDPAGEDDVVDMSLEITEEMAVDSELEGDVDADDIEVQRSSFVSPNPSMQTKEIQDDWVTGPREFRRTKSSAQIDPDPDESVSLQLTWEKKGSDPEKIDTYSFEEDFGARSIDVNFQDPLSCFEALFTTEILNMLVEQSNLYAYQNQCKLNLDLHELRAFLGMILIMGFHSLPEMELYWSDDKNFNVERISRSMPLERFLDILKCLHISDNSKMSKRGSRKFDRLFKVRPLMERLNESFRSNFNPCRWLSIDESVVKSEGRTSTKKQIMQTELVKRNFKVWALCCAKTGYALSLDVYTGGTKRGSIPLGEKVVKKLCAPYLSRGFGIYVSSHLSSVTLVENLLKKDTFCCGTIRGSSKHFPSESLKADGDVGAGEIDFVQSKDLSVVKWRDVGVGSGTVSVISSMHNPSRRRRVVRMNESGVWGGIKCPEAIVDHDKFAGGVGLFNQLCSCYSVVRESRKWWLTLFYYFFDAAVVNSYIMYKVTNEALNREGKILLSHLEFRSKLASGLMSKYINGTQLLASHYGRGKKRGDPHGRLAAIRLKNVGEHIIMKGTKRRCANCSTRAKVKRSSYFCSACNICLCIACFGPFHS